MIVRSPFCYGEYSHTPTNRTSWHHLERFLALSDHFQARQVRFIWQVFNVTPAPLCTLSYPSPACSCRQKWNQSPNRNQIHGSALTRLHPPTPPRYFRNIRVCRYSHIICARLKTKKKKCRRVRFAVSETNANHGNEKRDNSFRDS